MARIFFLFVILGSLFLVSSVSALIYIDNIGGTNGNSQITNVIYGSNITASESGNLISLTAYLQTGGNGNIRLAIYNNTFLLAESADTPSTTGANTLTMNPINIIGGGKYVLTVQLSNSNDKIYYNSGGVNQVFQNQAYGTFPNASTWSTQNNIFDMSMTYGTINTTSICVKDEDTLANLTYIVSFSNATYSISNSSQSCGSITNSINIPYPTATVNVQNGSYAPRNYLINNNLYSNTAHTFYLPLINSSWAVRFHTSTNGVGTPVQNVAANASLVIGIPTVVEQENSGGSGIATFYLEPTKTYQMSFYADGYQPLLESITPTTQDITIYLFPNTTNSTDKNYGNYYFNMNKQGGTYDNNSVILLNFTYVDFANITNYYGLNITYPNGTVILPQINNNQSGSILVIINTSTYVDFGSVDAVAFANRQDVGDITQTYVFNIISNTTTSYPTFLNIGASLNAAGGGGMLGNIIGIFFVALSIAFFSRISTSFVGSSVIGLLVLGLMLGMGIMNFAAPNAANAAWINWGTYIALWVGVASILYLWKGI